jgi:hypothetical protein
VPQATAAQLAAAGLDELPLAPAGQRVDLVAPQFSDPTRITNPLFPISNLRSAVLNGRVEGKPFRTETTLLPETRILEWPEGRLVRALVSQYVAYLDGRIEEVALDYYAQADDGSVWYFGEDVFNYQDGVVADLEGTWLAGREGPAAMIMPAHPQPGDVYRSENVPGLVFEQVTVKPAREPVEGPQGPVEGAIIAEELHQDGQREDKVFAPGYGEFFTGGGGDVEALALAVPTDELPGPPPPGLRTLLAGADRVFEQAGAKDWQAAARTAAAMAEAWRSFRASRVPPRLESVTSAAMARLVRTVDAREATKARQAALDVGQAALDLELRHRPPAEVDRGRFELWARQLLLDAGAEDAAGVAGDVATLEWIRDRIASTFTDVELTRLDTRLVELRTAVNYDALPGAAEIAAELSQL